MKACRAISACWPDQPDTKVAIDETRERFIQAVLPHLDSAYSLARWLVRDAHDAEDVVQDAVLRALRHFGGFRGSDARPWLMAIVRNASYAFLRARRPAELQEINDDEPDAAPAQGCIDLNPETVLMHKMEKAMLNEAITALPVAYRECLVLRELEDLSYREIAHIVDVPVGTVMSRLSRARRLLAQSLGAISHAAQREALK